MRNTLLAFEVAELPLHVCAGIQSIDAQMRAGTGGQLSHLKKIQVRFLESPLQMHESKMTGVLDQHTVFWTTICLSQ